MSTILLVLAAAGLAGAAFLTLNTILNLIVFRGLKTGPANRGKPLVSLLIPARNEAARIAPLIRSLTAQSWENLEIIVLDDNSTDGTSDVVLKLARGSNIEKRLRVITGEALPEGWTGKAWACHQLSQSAAGEWLLFTDADTDHASNTISDLVHTAEQTGAGLLSAWPQQITGTWSERLVIPLVYLLIVGFLPMWMLHLIQKSPALSRRIPASILATFGAANGQILLFRRATYVACGGHEAVRDHLVEDVALGRRVAGLTAQGHRLVNCDGSRHIRCRMYENFAQLWEGFSKNLRAAFDDALGMFIFSGVFQFVSCILPFFLIFVPGWPGRVAMLAVLLVIGTRALHAWRFRTTWWSVIFHVPAHLLALSIAMNSWMRTGGPGVTWKGRIYRGRAAESPTRKTS